MSVTPYDQGHDLDDRGRYKNLRQVFAQEYAEASDEQTFAEKLVDEGVEDAEQDTMVKGTRQSQHRDRRS